MHATGRGVFEPATSDCLVVAKDGFHFASRKLRSHRDEVSTFAGSSSAPYESRRGAVRR
jgi:hypothetical protein